MVGVFCRDVQHEQFKKYDLNWGIVRFSDVTKLTLRKVDAMGSSLKCGDCEKYGQQGHNYCRMCGNQLTKGYVPNVRVAVAYYTNEKFCGYCGGRKNECSCL